MTSIQRFIVGFLQTNCYVITSDRSKDAVIVDPGGGYGKISEYVRSLDKTPVAVLCTHGHFDHVMDCSKWEKDGAKIYINDRDRCLYSGEIDLFEGCKIDVDPFSVGGNVKDGDILTFSEMTFRVMYTPGHSKGSVCYVMNEETIFSGDTVFLHSFGRTDLYGGEYGELVDSVNVILRTEKDMRILPGHGESTTVREEKLFSPLYVR